MTLTSVVWCLLGPVPMAWAQWGPDGVPIAATSRSDSRPRIASDFSGGAFVVWSEGGTPKAQHIDAYGFPSWPGGLPVVGSDNTCPDGAGGFYVASGSLFIQRYGSDGSVAAGWPPGGIMAANPGGSVAGQ